MDVRAAREIGPRKGRSGKKWECRCNPAFSHWRIPSEWGRTLLPAARRGGMRGRKQGKKWEVRR